MRKLTTVLMLLFASAVSMLADDLVIPAPQDMVPGVVSKSPFKSAKKLFLTQNANVDMLNRKDPELHKWAIVGSIDCSKMPPDVLNMFMSPNAWCNLVEVPADRAEEALAAKRPDERRVYMGTKFVSTECIVALFLEYYYDSKNQKHLCWVADIRVRVNGKANFMELWQQCGTKMRPVTDYDSFVKQAKNWVYAIVSANGGTTEIHDATPTTHSKRVKALTDPATGAEAPHVTGPNN